MYSSCMFLSVVLVRVCMLNDDTFMVVRLLGELCLRLVFHCVCV